MRKSIELKNEKATLTEQYRTVLDRAAGEKRATNAEEKEQLRKMDTRFDELGTEILMYEKQETRESELAVRGNHGNGTQPQNDGRGEGSGKPQGIRATAAYHAAFVAAVFGGGMPSDVSPEVRNALQSDSDEGGGYLVSSEQLANRLIEAVDNEVFIRTMATKSTVTSAQSLGIPTRSGDVDDADWTPEIATGNEDTGLKFGKRELRPHPLSKRIKISKKLIRLTPMVEDKVIERLGYKFGVAQEKGFLLGTGAEQPLGVFVPSTDGISTARDVSTGLATGFSDADVLVDALYSLKGQYQKKAVWGFHRDAVRKIRKLKDLYGQYVWQPGISGGQPDTILNRPFFMSEYIPNTFTTGQYVGIIGDFSKYEIADALTIEIQRLIELYAEKNQVGFIGRLETDGMPVLEEAFVRLKTA
jgi:HK97 family phage major capsid protein